MKALQICALVAVCFGIPIALWQGLRLIPQALGSVPQISYVELVTILLTAITVILAILAIMVGIGALWGFEAIKKEAILSARSTSESFMAKHVKSDAMRAVIRDVVMEARDSVEFVGFTMPETTPSDDLKDPDRIAKDYPGDIK